MPLVTRRGQHTSPSRLGTYPGRGGGSTEALGEGVAMNERSRRFSGPWGALRVSLRGLLLVALVPVLVIAGSVRADAAPSYGSSVPLEISFDDWRPGVFGSCEVATYWSLSGIVLNLNGDFSCTTGWNLGGVDLGLLYSGSDADGDVCEANAEGLHHDGDGGDSSFTIGVDGLGGTTIECHITDVCWSVDSSEQFGPDVNQHWEDCEPLDLGIPVPLFVTSCPKGDFNRPTFNAPVLESTAYRQQWALSHWAETITAGASTVNNPGGAWSFYIVTQTNDGVTSSWDQTSPPTGYTPGPNSNNYNSGALVVPLQVSYFTYTGTGSVSPALGFPMSKRNSFASGNNPPISGTIIGAGVIGLRGHVNNWSTTPQQLPGGTLGTTDAASCNFYWGTKIASVVGSNIDEPAGPLTTPLGGTTPPTQDPTPPPAGDGACEDAGAGFSVFDPSSWGGAAMCNLVSLFAKAVGLLGDILGALTGLAEVIATAVSDAIVAGFNLLGDVLQLLFVPTGDGWVTFIDDMNDEFENSDVGDWSDALQGVTGGGGSERAAPGRSMAASAGCAGPTISLGFFEDAGLPADWQPLNACSGTAADLAYWSHLILTVFLVVGAGSKIIEYFLVQLGVLKNTHTLVSHDWSGRF